MFFFKLIASCVVLTFGAYLGYASLWSEWKPYPVFKDISFADGKQLESKSRTFPCLMCTSGPISEYALFSSTNKFYPREIGRIVSKAVLAHTDEKNWTRVCCSYDSKQWLFSNIRVFAPSVEPLVVVVMPWAYVANLNGPFAAKDIFAEAQDFQGQALTREFYAVDWPDELRNVIELRNTLPSQASKITVITAQGEQTLVIPHESNGALEFKTLGLQIVFERKANGLVEVKTTPRSR